MRRTDTKQVGREAEDFAARLLSRRGFSVRNLNDERNNTPLYDLLVEKDGSQALISVKCARAKRQLRLGAPRILERLDDHSIVMAFLPPKGREIAFEPGGYELLIVPGAVARDDALAAHRHYALTHPGSANHSVMVKDKIDRNPETRSGAVFHSWYERFRDEWDVLDRLVG